MSRRRVGASGGAGRAGRAAGSGSVGVGAPDLALPRGASIPRCAVAGAGGATAVRCGVAEGVGTGRGRPRRKAGDGSKLHFYPSGRASKPSARAKNQRRRSDCGQRHYYSFRARRQQTKPVCRAVNHVRRSDCGKRHSYPTTRAPATTAGVRVRACSDATARVGPRSDAVGSHVHSCRRAACVDAGESRSTPDERAEVDRWAEGSGERRDAEPSHANFDEMARRSVRRSYVQQLRSALLGSVHSYPDEGAERFDAGLLHVYSEKRAECRGGKW